MRRTVTSRLSTAIVIFLMLSFIYLPVLVLVAFSFQSGDLPVPPFDGPSSQVVL